MSTPMGESRWYESAADLLREPDPGPTPMLIEDLIAEGAVAALVGTAKVRKTWVSLALGIAVVTGEPALGRFVVSRPGPVLVVLEESGRAALHRRLDMLTRGRAIDPELLREFHFAANRRVRLDQDEWKERLREAARARPWRLIVFDPFVRVKGWANENEQREIGPILDFLRELRDESGAAVLYNHHTPHDGGRQRGTSDFEAYWESKLTLIASEDERTLEAEHRETEGAGPFQVWFRFHAETRTLRIDADESELHRLVREYDEMHPTATATEIYEALKSQGQGGRKQTVLDVVRNLRERRFPAPEPTGTLATAESVSQLPPSLSKERGGLGTDGVAAVPSDSEPFLRPLVAAPNYLPWLFERFERGLLSENEWHQAYRAHRFVVVALGDAA